MASPTAAHTVTARDLALIRQLAIQAHLDPKAVFAIASHEGLSGRVGDGGHAFGPGQMNDAGGVLTGAPAGHHSNQYAWSRAGIEQWISGMAAVAAGKRGRAAVTAIASRYERPANVAGEIADAMSHYGKVGPTGSGGGASAGISGGGGGPTLGAGQMITDQATMRKQMALAMGQAAVARAQGQQVNGNDLLQQFAQIRAANTDLVSSTGQGAGPKGIVAPGSSTGLKAVALASKQIGIPYVWGGENRKGFDCSGLVQFVYGKLGINLPRVAADQGKAGRAVGYGQMKPGDLLVENNGDHVVIYAGNGEVIAAPHTGTTVQRQPLSYFPASQYHARRVA